MLPQPQVPATDHLALAAALLATGLLSSYPVWRFDVRLLEAYPLWVWRRIRDRFAPGDPWLRTAALLFLFNATSLGLNVLVGAGVTLPHLYSYLLGLNVGVVSCEEMGARGLVAVTLLNPVAWLELPAATVAGAAGIAVGEAVLAGGLAALAPALGDAAASYATVVLPLLAAAAALEAAMIAAMPAEREPGKRPAEGQ